MGPNHAFLHLKLSAVVEVEEGRICKIWFSYLRRGMSNTLSIPKNLEKEISSICQRAMLQLDWPIWYGMLN